MRYDSVGHTQSTFVAVALCGKVVVEVEKGDWRQSNTEGQRIARLLNLVLISTLATMTGCYFKVTAQGTYQLREPLYQNR